ncbi:MAG: hypothetical protein U9Q04_07955 [Campylobacterota bacterium]|nr:hypothetical protein [Campylobacterota bacterium]
MRILFLTILFILAVDARENPFAPTQTYEEKKTQMLKELYEKEALEQEKAKFIIAQEKAEKQNLKEEEFVELEIQPKKISPFKIKEGCKESYDFLPLSFVKVKTSEDNIQFHLSDNYKLINQDILVDRNKFVFDFEADLIFYTKREKLCHSYFKSFAIGNHPKQRYFRIVVELSDKVSSYKENLDIKNSILTIYRKAPAK